MDIAVKQRILGGIILISGAVLFLPVLLQGAGVKALQPPAAPVAPKTPTTADLAPPLQKNAAKIDQDIGASHGEPTFYPVQPSQAPTPAISDETPEQFKLVTPGKPAAGVQTDAAGKKPLESKIAETKPADSKPAEKAQADKLLAEKQKSDKLKAQQADAKAKADKLAAAPKAADPDPVLPQAWVVQVAVLSSKDKAQALEAQLRAKGFRASVTGSGDKWRVVTGPELDKSVADAVRTRLDAAGFSGGWIQAYRP